jgi:hypothetical protein
MHPNKSGPLPPLFFPVVEVMAKLAASAQTASPAPRTGAPGRLMIFCEIHQALDRD